MAAAAAPFLYDTLSPLGDSETYDGVDDNSRASPFLSLANTGSPRTETSVVEQSTSSLTIKRRETKRSSFEEIRNDVVTPEGMTIETIIAENFSRKLDESGLTELGQHSTYNNYSLSRTNIQSISNVQTEEQVDELEYISLNLNDGNVEIMVEEGLHAKGKQVLTTEAQDVTPKEAPPWARKGDGRDTWIQSPLLQLHQGFEGFGGLLPLLTEIIESMPEMYCYISDEHSCAEIVDFCDFVAPTEEEEHIRATAVQRVSLVVKSIWPSCQVKVFGSFATGLYLPTSDVDVVILHSGCQVRQDGLKALAKSLTRNSVAKSLQVIAKARVPIVKFVETNSNIPFDISFDVANGPEAADFIKGAMESLPPLRPLCLVLKIFLQQRELNEVYQGGIGSYALLVMLLSHLQMHPSKRRASSRGQANPLESNLGILLVDFFNLYGRTLNVKDVGISCQNGGRFFSKKDRGFSDSKRPFLLCVEDPQTPDNDIGKNSYAIQKVRSAFVLAHRLLTNLSVDKVPDSSGLLGRIVRMDSKLVARKVPLLLTPTPSDLPGRRPYPAPYAGYHHHHIPEPEPEPYIVGDGTFSNSDSDQPAFKTPEPGRRSRWHDYEEDDFPRGETADPYLSKKARKAARKKLKDQELADRELTYSRFKHSPHIRSEGRGDFSRKRGRHESPAAEHTVPSKHSVKSKQHFRSAESSGPEEGEMRQGRRFRRRQERVRRSGEVEPFPSPENVPGEHKSRQKHKQVVNVENFSVNGEKIAARSKHQNQHTYWNEEDKVIDNGRSSFGKKVSRFLNSPICSRGREGYRKDFVEPARRVVITKPAHKKIKYV